MFSSLLDETAVFIDYSNVFYVKYTVGRYFNIEKLLDYCRQEDKISQVGFYGAYDLKNLKQYNRFQNLIKTYSSDKCHMYLKPLECHGSKNKGNVDTEMGFDLQRFKDKYKTLILFSGDGDFAYPLKELMSQGKNVVICSTRGHISGLINLTQEYPQKCKFLDFNSKRKESIGLRTIIKDDDKGLALSPHLQEFISKASSGEIKELYDFVECLLNQKYYNNKQAAFFRVEDKNNYPIYKNIAKRNIEEKQLLIAYLKKLL